MIFTARDLRFRIEAEQAVRRAEALFNLATVTRQQGMGLIGTEGPPDEQVLSGMFAYGVGQSSPSGVADKPSKLLGPDEARRFAASAPRSTARSRRARSTS